MSGPSSAPRGERAGTPGARWETELQSLGEQYVPDGQPEPRPNRATRRAAKRAQKPAEGRETPWGGPAGPQEAREGAWTPVSRPNDAWRSRSRGGPQNGAQSHDATTKPRTETK